VPVLWAEELSQTAARQEAVRHLQSVVKVPAVEPSEHLSAEEAWALAELL
jgi:hypothetical protein